MWQGKKTDGGPEPQGDEYSPVSSYATSGPVPSHINATHVGHYADDGLRFSDPQTPLPGPSYHHGAAQDYPQRSPALSYTCGENEARPHPMEPQRMARYDQYSYAIDGGSRDGAWQQAVGPHPSDSGALDSGSSTHSPSFIESPSLTTPDLTYSNRYVDDQKITLDPLNTSSTYMFSTSRSISPAASTPTSTSSSSIAPAGFAFNFSEGSAVQDRPEFGFRRTHGAELTLHGGTADIAVAPSANAIRYRVGGRTKAVPDRSETPGIGPYSRADGRDNDDTESTSSYSYSTPSHTRGTNTSQSSRSPPSNRPPLCSTLAVIKAQAFGALRRTRARSKRSSEGAAKAAVQALEARGIGIDLGPESKRPKLHHDEGDMNI